ncbi:MAG: type I-E CRISPR-associated protein Cse2/CasB [Deltaproteobacteria bacterium]|nr:type I-E CRISPR-associated protein Cse2/CasB [Deltaproteobacteria bacterium]
MNIHDEVIESAARTMRERFDREKHVVRPLRSGDVAAIKRYATVGDALVDGAFWALFNEHKNLFAGANADETELDRVASAVAIAVCTFGAARAGAPSRSLGAWIASGLRAKGLPEGGANLRFRQLAAARTPDELVRRLRALLKLIGLPVDWGVVVKDVLHWSKSAGSRERVTRAWARGFYGSTDDEADDTDRGAKTAATKTEGATER